MFTSDEPGVGTTIKARAARPGPLLRLPLSGSIGIYTTSQIE
jgi:hypothetical protein